jgi:HD-like signal output (HDOD) protein
MCARRIESIRDAVLVLGINSIKGLTTAVSVQQGLSKLRPQTKEFDSTSFWKHSYATAIAVARRASAEAPAMRDKLYLVGLIHDIGKLIQAFYWPDGWAATVNMSRSERIPYEEAEHRVFGFGHYKIAIEVCTSWQFPDEMVALLKQLSQAETAGSDDIGPSGRMLHRAHLCVNLLGYRCPPGDIVRPPEEEETIESGFSEELANEVEYQLRILER